MLIYPDQAIIKTEIWDRKRQRKMDSSKSFPFLICWYQSHGVKHRNVLNKVVNVRSKITGTAQETLWDLYNKQLWKKAESILSDCSHPLHQQFQFRPSGTLLILPQAKTNRLNTPLYLPSAIFLLNLLCFFLKYFLRHVYSFFGLRDVFVSCFVCAYMGTIKLFFFIPDKWNWLHLYIETATF